MSATRRPAPRSAPRLVPRPASRSDSSPRPHPGSASETCPGEMSRMGLDPHPRPHPRPRPRPRPRRLPQRALLRGATSVCSMGVYNVSVCVRARRGAAARQRAEPPAPSRAHLGDCSGAVYGKRPGSDLSVRLLARSAGLMGMKSSRSESCSCPPRPCVRPPPPVGLPPTWAPSRPAVGEKNKSPAPPPTPPPSPAPTPEAYMVLFDALEDERSQPDPGIMVAPVGA